MEYNTAIEYITKQLKGLIDSEYKQNQYKYHSKEFLLLGVRTIHVRNLIKDIYTDIRLWNEQDVYNLIEILLKMKYNEYITIGFGLATKWTKNLQDYHFEIFESWIANYVIDWGQCDDLCCNVLGKFIYEHKNFISKVFNWTESKNTWFRRASAVSLIYSLRRGKYSNECFQIADKLLLDTHDMVQKGYGWMLKVASKNFEIEVFNFLMSRKKTIPRIALRYAIEKMSPDLKKKVMSKT